MTSEPLDMQSLRRFVSWVGLGLALFCIYLLTASQQYDPDILGELAAINRLDMSSADPAHMLYVRLGVPFYRLWLALGYQGDGLAPMQVLNAFFGAGAIMVFALVLRRWAVQWTLALLVSTAAALSYAFWTHTVDAFFIISAAFFAITALFCAATLPTTQSSERRVILVLLLGLSLSLAVLSYQTNLALIPALLAASWPIDRGYQSRTSYIKTWIVAGAIFVLLAGGVWLWQAVKLAGAQGPQAVVAWFLLGHGGMDEGLWRREGVNLLTTVPVAWLATIVPVYEGLGLRALTRGVVSIDRLPAQFALVLLGIAFTLVILVLVRRPSLLRSRAFLVSTLWFLLPGIAVLWFDPAEVKLWLIPMFGLWSLLALALSGFATNSAGQRLAVALMASIVLVLALGNFLVPVWPNHRTPSRNLAVASQAASYLQPADLMISASFDWTGYLNYLSEEYRVFNAVAVAQSQGRQAVKPLLEDAITTTWQQGGRVYIVDYFDPSHQETWERWIMPFTWLTPGDLERYGRVYAWQTSQDETIWELMPRP